MSRECPVCNSDVPADGRCCNVKCEAYSHRVLDALVESQQVEIIGRAIWTLGDTHISADDVQNALDELGGVSSRPTATEVRELREDFDNVLKEKQQEIFNQIVEAQKEFGKHTIYKKEFTIPAEENEVGAWKTIDWKMGSKDEPEVITIDKLCGWEPVEIPTDFKWNDGEMYYQFPKDTPVTFEYYGVDLAEDDTVVYKYYCIQTGTPLEITEEEYYNRPYEQTLRIAQPRDVDE